MGYRTKSCLRDAKKPPAPRQRPHPRSERRIGGRAGKLKTDMGHHLVTSAETRQRERLEVDRLRKSGHLPHCRRRVIVSAPPSRWMGMAFGSFSFSGSTVLLFIYATAFPDPSSCLIRGGVYRFGGSWKMLDLSSLDVHSDASLLLRRSANFRMDA